MINKEKTQQIAKIFRELAQQFEEYEDDIPQTNNMKNIISSMDIPNDIKTKMSSIRLSQLSICQINALKSILSLSTNEEVINTLINQQLINLSTEQLNNYKMFLQAEINKNKNK